VPSSENSCGIDTAETIMSINRSIIIIIDYVINPLIVAALTLSCRRGYEVRIQIAAAATPLLYNLSCGWERETDPDDHADVDSWYPVQSLYLLCKTRQFVITIRLSTSTPMHLTQPTKWQSGASVCRGMWRYRYFSDDSTARGHRLFGRYNYNSNSSLFHTSGVLTRNF